MSAPDAPFVRAPVPCDRLEVLRRAVEAGAFADERAEWFAERGERWPTPDDVEQVERYVRAAEEFVGGRFARRLDALSVLLGYRDAKHYSWSPEWGLYLTMLLEGLS